tara:strand:- start:1400 stop:1579 length:180 start_codon:yes stop_codon:yes gene_type:complete
MGKYDTPEIPPVKTPPAPVIKQDAAETGRATKKRLQERKGAMASWITRGQSLGGGLNLK